MAGVTLPEGHADSFDELSSLSDTDRKSIEEALNTGDATPRALSRALSGKVKDPAVTAQALIAFTSWRLRRGLEPEPAFAELADQFKDVDATRLEGIARAEPLVMLSKSVDLGLAHYQILQSSRIITDLRPVFTDDETPRILASTISHQLVLRTIRESDYTEVFVTLDEDDLRELQEHIHRALDKQTKLREMTDKLGIKTVDWSDTE